MTEKFKLLTRQERVAGLNRMIDKVIQVADRHWAKEPEEPDAEDIVNRRARTARTITIAADHATRLSRSINREEIDEDVDLQKAVEIFQRVERAKKEIEEEEADNGRRATDTKGDHQGDRSGPRTDPEVRLARTGAPGATAAGNNRGQSSVDDLADSRRARRRQDPRRGRMDQKPH